MAQALEKRDAQSRYVIFGAGQNGYALTKFLGESFFRCFIDNDSQKWGGRIGHLPICSIHSFFAQAFVHECIVVFTFESGRDEEKLKQKGVKYLSLKDFLVSEDIILYRDESLLVRYRYDTWLKKRCFAEAAFDLFRQEYRNEFQRLLVQKMRDGEQEDVDALLRAEGEQYALDCPVDENGMYFDEYFSYRFDMRLIHRLLEQSEGRSVCDLACGHGELLSVLKERHHVVGVDLAPERVTMCKAHGIEAYQRDAADTGLPDEMFDVVISEENLEHVMDPLAVMSEAWRILKPGGIFYVSVPLGTDCDCQEHVRFFSVNMLFSMLCACCFEVENIITIPYVNENLYENNIFAGAIKREL